MQLLRAGLEPNPGPTEPHKVQLRQIGDTSGAPPFSISTKQEVPAAPAVKVVTEAKEPTATARVPSAPTQTQRSADAADDRKTAERKAEEKAKRLKSPAWRTRDLMQKEFCASLTAARAESDALREKLKEVTDDKKPILDALAACEQKIKELTVLVESTGIKPLTDRVQLTLPQITNSSVAVKWARDGAVRFARWAGGIFTVVASLLVAVDHVVSPVYVESVDDQPLDVCDETGKPYDLRAANHLPGNLRDVHPYLYRVHFRAGLGYHHGVVSASLFHYLQSCLGSRTVSDDLLRDYCTKSHSINLQDACTDHGDYTTVIDDTMVYFALWQKSCKINFQYAPGVPLLELLLTETGQLDIVPTRSNSHPLQGSNLILRSTISPAMMVISAGLFNVVWHSLSWGLPFLWLIGSIIVLLLMEYASDSGDSSGQGTWTSTPFPLFRTHVDSPTSTST